MPASPWDAIKNMSLRCTVKINGAPLKDEYGLESLSITHQIGTISTAELSIAGNYSGDFSSLSVADDEVFSPGHPIEIMAGYDDKGETLLFKGCIVSQSVKLGGEQPVGLQLNCKHEAVKMTFQKKIAVYDQKKDSAILTQILADNNFSDATVASTKGKETTFVQDLATDWDIMISRAEANGLMVYMDADTIKISEPKLSGSPVMRLASGESILDFSAEIIADRQPVTLEAYGWDDKMALVQATAKEPAMNAQGNLAAKQLASKFGQLKEVHVFSTTITKDDLQLFADSRLLRVRMSALKGSVSFLGSSLVKTGCLIQLEGVGAKYNGIAYVSSVTHSISKGMWKTSAKFGLEDKPAGEKQKFSKPPAANGQVPATQGLAAGKVVKLQDPQVAGTQYKVLVSLPSGGNKPNEVWARVANFYATDGAGTGFLPEVGDHILVGFLDNDPRCPVMLGSLYGSEKAAPNPATDENNYIKSITTKSKMKLSFDEEKKIIKIETPGANMITIDDDGKSVEIKDQNNNIIKTDADGIKLTSDKDISLNATGDLKLTAKGKIVLATSSGDVEVSGANIKNKATAGFSAKGNSTAEVSSSGDTTIKGAMVMIN